MKRILMAASTVTVMTSALVAGGDIAPVEPAVVVPVVTENTHKGFYAGIAYSYLSHDMDYTGHGTKAEMDFNAILLELGYQFNQYIAAEGRYTATIGDDIDDLTSSSDADAYGLFVKPMLPLSHRATVYGLLGYSMTEASSTFENIKNDFDESGFSWGGGFSLDINENFTGFVEYMRWYDDTVDEYDHVVDGFSLGVFYRF